jgi:hypothetical protein
MKKEKTMHELVKEFPDKSYRELEIYKEKDRQEEAQQIPLSESQQKQEELEPIGEGGEQDNPELFKTEIDYHRYWKDMYEKEHKQRQEAEGETTIVKGIGQNSPEMKTLRSEVEALKQQLHTDREKYKRENNDLFNRIADALAINEDHQKMNGKLQERLTELEEENKKMHNHLNKKIEGARKAGL